MNKTFRKTSAMLCAITVMASSMSIGGFVASAGEPAPTSDYTITIPATLTVANKGWNATDGVSATGTLEDGKKLVVTATSDDEFALVNQEDNTQKIGYKLATASTDTEATTSWEFTELSGTAATKPMGIIVDDYSGKPAGTYQDFVTFTATVEDAVKVVDLSTISGQSYNVTENVILTGTPNEDSFTIRYTNNNYKVTLDNVNSAGNKTVRVNGSGYNMNIKLKGTSKLKLLGTSETLTIDEAEAGGTVILVSDMDPLRGSTITINGGTVKARGNEGSSVFESLTVNGGAVYLAGYDDNAVDGSVTAGSGVTLYGWSGSAWTTDTNVQYVTTDSASGNPENWDW